MKVGMIDSPSPFDATGYRLIAGLVTGLVLGSFATMLGYRLPRRLSIVWPGSHCPVCKTPLKPADLVPLVSWAVLRGKCRYCGAFTLWLLLPLALIVTMVTALAVWLERRSV